VRFRVSALIVMVVALVSACGGSSSGSNAAFNKADVEFAQGMIPHHEQAIEMADRALDPKAQASDAVRSIATSVKAAQDGEIKQMKQWLTTWKQPIEMDTSNGHNMSDMEGMLSADEVQAIAKVTGADFDRLFLKLMIAHHRDAVSMANTVLKQGKAPEVKPLATAIGSAQQAEIAAMEKLLVV
jgi:uncharacterized protein (DUF305 family)